LHGCGGVPASQVLQVFEVRLQRCKAANYANYANGRVKSPLTLPLA